MLLHCNATMSLMLETKLPNNSSCCPLTVLSWVITFVTFAANVNVNKQKRWKFYIRNKNRFIYDQETRFTLDHYGNRNSSDICRRNEAVVAVIERHSSFRGGRSIFVQ